MSEPVEVALVPVKGIWLIIDGQAHEITDHWDDVRPDSNGRRRITVVTAPQEETA